MPKAVMISIKPKWCKSIASGEKTVEVRKNSPKLETPFKVYIYCTNVKVLTLQEYAEIHLRSGGKIDCWHGKVIGEFVCDKIFPIRVFENGTIQDYMFHNIEQSCVPYDDIANYIGNGRTGYGWHISDLKIYEKPRNLHDFHKCGAASMDDLLDSEELCTYCSDTNYGELKCCGTPSGPVMCEGRFCDSAYQEYLDDNNFTLGRPPQSWCCVEEVEQA